MIELNYGGVNYKFTEEQILSPTQHFQKLCKIPSDINEHLPTLKRYAEECDLVTEMGVRFACSTWAFIESKPSKLTCIDINYEFFKPSEKYVRQMCENYKIDFSWITGDTLNIEIENTDLLFIDTLHTYNQLLSELVLHHSKVSKYIILHDTVSFGKRDESIYKHASTDVKNKPVTKVGLKDAIADFLYLNKEWYIDKEFVNNNGLTILSKKY